MNGIVHILKKGRIVLSQQPPYDDGLVAHDSRAYARRRKDAERRRLRFLLLDTMQTCAEHGDSYIVEHASDATWRELACLVESACFETEAEDGTRFVITRRGLAILDEIIREGGAL